MSKTEKQAVNTGRRRFLTAATTVVGAVGVGFFAVPFIASWQPSAKARAIGAPVDVDIGKLEPGQKLTVTWRGKPVWIVRRSDQTLTELASLEGVLRDPRSEVETQQPAYCQNKYRSLKPEYLVLVGICTHLGCSPTYVPEGEAHSLGPEWKGGFFCPCHGSRFDMAGRVFQGVPAPTNLEVPAYHYESETRVVIGVDPASAQA
ncbi:MAG: ubiquinol-cytochrome c reductase iron-sulfur subunit [Gammaproteobacteria bacterium]